MSEPAAIKQLMAIREIRDESRDQSTQQFVGTRNIECQSLHRVVVSHQDEHWLRNCCFIVSYLPPRAHQFRHAAICHSAKNFICYFRSIARRVSRGHFAASVAVAPVAAQQLKGGVLVKTSPRVRPISRSWHSSSLAIFRRVRRRLLHFLNNACSDSKASIASKTIWSSLSRKDEVLRSAELLQS